MATPRFEVPSGTIDGVNTTFTTSLPYQAGSLAVFINGLLMRADLLDGWVETAPTTGTFDLKEAPRVGPSGGGCEDVIKVFFLDTAPAVLECVTTPLCGTIKADPELVGCLADAIALCGEVKTSDLSGCLVDELLLCGTVEAEVSLVGVLEVCA